jgi:hypothetical protein
LVGDKEREIVKVKDETLREKSSIYEQLKEL